MINANSESPGLTWLAFACLTVFSWGVYGVFLHTGQLAMQDPVTGRYKAFLFVGIAYFLTAVLAPLAMLVVRGANWQYPPTGVGWSLMAGIVGAVGAFCVLLAFGAKGTLPVVMSIVFAGAPIVNALVGISMDQNWGNVSWKFVLGILLAAAGGGIVTIYKPPPKPHAAPTPPP